LFDVIFFFLNIFYWIIKFGSFKKYFLKYLLKLYFEKILKKVKIFTNHLIELILVRQKEMKYINLILIIISLIFLTKGCEVDGIDISLISTPRKLPANPRLFK
jgi:hypothetical protein